MEKTVTGEIRKIIIGENPTNTLAYEVGKIFRTPEGEVKIVSIVEDQSHFYFFGNIRFLIFVELPDKEIKVWKYFDRMPVLVECVI